MRLTLFLIAFCTAVTTNGQSITLSIGPSQPVGAFASQNGAQEGAGLARIGGVLDLSYQHPLHGGPFGFSAGLRARLNPMNEDANLAYPKSRDTGYTYTVDKTSWEAGGIFVGAYYRKALSSKLSVEAGVSVGGVYTVLPALSATGLRKSVLYPGSQDYQTVRANKAHALAPSILPRLGIRYPLTSHFSFTLHAAFCYLRPTFKNITEWVESTQGLNVPGLYSFANSAGPIIGYDQTRNITQSMCTVDLDAGLSLRL
ncbi:hypothetical protein [Dinghuibacter silviterrae]|uniref:Outer membrane protein with beta-barrel domain n=1 Tax=Dinghuibacter silviterrae TaxID=1539049 RepID=A0A4R8DRN2_9BACT|nr:hypothetical protein [Dinghuibacter silviterrae]TDX00870.1 hypothetical protein EDB95_1899 [Dinghuibacter silviterrae]